METKLFNKFFSVLAIGLCVFAENAVAASSEQDPCVDTGDPVVERQPGQSGLAYSLEIQKLIKEKKSACDAKKVADAQMVEFIETPEFIELKGVKIGMTSQELLRLYPKLSQLEVPLDNEYWYVADTLVFYNDDKSECVVRGGLSQAKDCVTLLKKNAFQVEFKFIDNKLHDAIMNFERGSDSGDQDSDFYSELLEALSVKFKASPKSKDTQRNSGYGRPIQLRSVGWKSTTCKCVLQVNDDDRFVSSRSDHVNIKLTSDAYSSIKESRKKVFAERENQALIKKEAERKGDL